MAPATGFLSQDSEMARVAQEKTIILWLHVPKKLSLAISKFHLKFALPYVLVNVTQPGPLVGMELGSSSNHAISGSGGNFDNLVDKKFIG